MTKKKKYNTSAQSYIFAQLTTKQCQTKCICYSVKRMRANVSQQRLNGDRLFVPLVPNEPPTSQTALPQVNLLAVKILRIVLKKC